MLFIHDQEVVPGGEHDEDEVGPDLRHPRAGEVPRGHVLPGATVRPRRLRRLRVLPVPLLPALQRRPAALAAPNGRLRRPRRRSCQGAAVVVVVAVVWIISVIPAAVVGDGFRFLNVAPTRLSLNCRWCS